MNLILHVPTIYKFGIRFKYLLLSILFTLIFIFQSNESHASHAMGADLTYQCLGGNQYRIRLSFYRDCGGISPSSSFSMNYSSVSCSQNLTATLNLLTGYPIEVSPLCASQIINSRCNGGTLPGVQQYVYEGIITLPANCSDWILSVTECCRNNTINTLTSPSAENIYIESRLNNLTVTCNSSPTFFNLPVPYVCLGQPLSYNHGAFDADGDSLYYELVPCLTLAGTSVAYGAGFSATTPFSSSTTIAIDPNNGTITATPSAIQVGAIAVRVYEYRGGVLIGSVVRDIQLTVISCTNNPPTLSGYTGVTGGVLVSSNLINVCVGSPISFMVIGSDLNPLDSLGFITNVAVALPGATFSIRGRNPDTLIVNWTPTVASTGFNAFSVTSRDNACPIFGQTTNGYEIIVSGVRIDATDTISRCLSSATPISLTAVGSSTGYTWSVLSGDLTSLICTTCNPTTVNPTITTRYRVVGTAPSGCPVSDTVTVVTVPFFSVNSRTDTTICAGRSVVLNTSSTGVTSGISYTWTPSTGLSNPNIASPLATPTITTTYVLRGAVGTCYSYDTVIITVNTSPIVDATISPINYCNGDTVTFNAYIPVDAPRCDTYTVASIPHTPLTTTGTNITLGDDQVSTAIPIGFNFNFFCNNYSNIYISSNGFATFNGASGSGCCSGGTIPTADGVDNIISLFWNDLYPPAGGTINYYTTGIAPNRRFVINFNAINHCCSAGATNTGQIVLYETTNVIDLFLTNVTDDGSTHTAGIENSTGTRGFSPPGRNSGNWITANEAWRFTPVVFSTTPYIYSWTPTTGLFPRTDTAITRHIVTTPRSYYVTVSRGGCSIIDTVNVAPRLDVRVTPDTTICAGMPVRLNAIIVYDTIRTTAVARCDSYTVATIPYALNTTGSGSGVFLSDDQVSVALPIGFNFNFFCNNYSNFYVSSNGFITFNGASGSGCCGGQVLPNALDPNNLIALFWDDLYPPGAGSINYFVSGISPNRVLVVNYTNIPLCCGSTPAASGQLILYETTNVIELHITSAAGINPGTAGIENATGTLAYTAPGRNGVAWPTLVTNTSYRFTPVVTTGSVTAVTFSWAPTTGLSSTTVLNPLATTSTTINYIIITTAGTCIDRDTATITIRAKDSVYITRTICSNQFFLFNGVNRNTAGTYRDTLLNTGGCDSLVVLNLIVNPTRTGSISATICSNQFYLFNGINRNTTGTYLDTFTAVNGCDSVVTLNLTIRPTTTGTINQSICAGTTYNFNGVNRSTAGTYLDTLVGSNGCDSVVTLNLTIRPTTTGTINQSICAGTTYNFNGVNRSTAGTYLDTLVGSNGCDSVVTLNLTIRPTTTGTINQSICAGTTYSFNGVNRSTTGTYLDTLLGSNGCDSFLTLNLIVRGIVNITIQPIICEGEVFEVGSSAYTSSGNYIDTLINIFGCDSIITTRLAVIPNVTDSQSIVLCLGEQLSIGSNVYNTSGRYFDTLISSIGCDSILITNLIIQSPIIINIDTTICSGTIYNGVVYTSNTIFNDTLLNSSIGCDSLIHHITINILPNDSLLVSNDTVICAGQQVQLFATGGGTGIYTWTPNNYLSCVSCPNPISIPSSGSITYIVNTNDCNGDVLSASVNVFVKDLPTIKVLTIDTCVYLGQLLDIQSIDDRIDFNTTNWAINGINICIDCPNHTFQPYIQGTYIATVTDSLGCSASDSIDICLINECGDTTIVLPNFVTPNGDGANDVFRFENPNNLAITFTRVFNRWGEMIFESYEPNPSWDATYQGILVNSGVYVAYIEGICASGGRFLKTCNISVIK